MNEASVEQRDSLHLRVFVLDGGQALPRRREGAKNRQVFGCGYAAPGSSVVSYWQFT